MEPGKGLRTQRQHVGQELQRHRLIQFEVFRLIDLAHAAFVEKGDDLISIDRRARYLGRRVRCRRAPAFVEMRAVPFS
jgi:hypothetical protein